MRTKKWVFVFPRHMQNLAYFGLCPMLISHLRNHCQNLPTESDTKRDKVPTELWWVFQRYISRPYSKLAGLSLLQTSILWTKLDPGPFGLTKELKTDMDLEQSWESSPSRQLRFSQMLDHRPKGLRVHYEEAHLFVSTAALDGCIDATGI